MSAKDDMTLSKHNTYTSSSCHAKMAIYCVTSQPKLQATLRASLALGFSARNFAPGAPCGRFAK